MPQIDAVVRQLVWAYLSDDTIGYNMAVDRAVASAAYDGVDPKRVKNNGWQLGKTAFFGLLTPDAIEETTTLIYPVFCMDIISSQPGTQSGRLVMSATFAGTIQFGIQVHLSWPQENALADFSKYGDLVQDAMYATLNNPDSQMFTSGLAYGGRLAMQRGPIAEGGLNWRQTLSFTGTFAAVIE